MRRQHAGTAGTARSSVRGCVHVACRRWPSQVLLQIITPYTRIRIAFIADELNISAPEVEQLLVALILDGQIDGHIDQMQQLLLLRQTSEDVKKCGARPACHAYPLAVVV